MEYLIKASVLITIFYICYKTFLQKETFFESNRWFLLAGLIVAFIIPLIVIPIYITKTTEPLQNLAFIPNVTTTNEGGTIDLLQIGFILYLIGVISLATRFIIQFYSLFQLINKTSQEKIDNYIFVKTSDDVSPFSFFKWIVYNPNQFNNNELLQIINHEKIHARQHHSLDILLSQLSTIVFWFNPIVWLYKKDLQQNLEFIADYSAQNRSQCKKSYQHLLLKTSVPNYQLALTNNFYNSLIKKRIVMLHKSRSKKLNQLKYLLILPVIGLFLMSFNTKEVINYEYPNLEPVTVINNTQPIEKMEIVIITKDMTNDELEKITNDFKSKDVELKFSNIKRNKENEITSIKIYAKTAKSNANFNTQDDDAINDIIIKIDYDNNSISIGNGHAKHDGKDFHFVSKDGEHTIHKNKKGSNVFVHSIDDKDHKGEKIYIVKKGDKVHKKGGHTFVTDDDSEKVFITTGKGKSTWTTDDGHKIKVNKIGEGDNDSVIFISDEDEKSPIYIIDGKEVSEKKMKNLDSDQIESINVLKGKSATKKYGKKGKDGVIEITTKKK